MPQPTECDCLIVVDVDVVLATVCLKSDDVDNWVAARVR